MPKYFENIDLNKNKLLKSKVEITDREAIETDDVIDKQYVDDNDTYASDLSDIDDGLNSGKPLISIGGIDTNFVVDGKTNKELWDALFYPRTSPIYTEPTINLVGLYSDTNTGNTVSLPFEVGQLIDVNLTANYNLNDSDGLNGSSPFTWSGSGLAGSQVTGNNNISLSLDLQTSNSWSVTAAFLGAATKNDSYGDPDTTGIFGNVTKTDNLSLTAYWPYWIDVQTGNTTAPTNDTELRSLSNKSLGSRPTSFNVTLPGDGQTKTLIIAVPASNASISAVKDGAQPIAASAWTKTTISNVLSIGNSGQTQNYTIFRHDNGIGFTTDSVYSITITY